MICGVAIVWRIRSRLQQHELAPSSTRYPRKMDCGLNLRQDASHRYALFVVLRYYREYITSPLVYIAFFVDVDFTGLHFR